MYRNPRFSYVHTLADFGDGGFGVGTDAYLTPRTRLMDYLSKALCGQADSNQETWFRRDIPQPQTFYPLSRIIIPAGHNYGADRKLQFEWFGDFIETEGAGDFAILNDSAIINAFLPSRNLLDIELDSTDTGSLFALMLMWQHWASNSADLPAMGELWWTNIVQPATGIHFGWTDVVDPTDTRFVARSGASYRKVNGEPLRRFNLQHSALLKADADLYDELFRYVGYGSKSFWYDHPDSADVEQSINDLSDHTDITNELNMVTATVIGGAPDGVTDATMFIASGVGNAYGQIDVAQSDDPTLTDWRGFELQFDFKIPTGGVPWFDAVSDFAVAVRSTATAGVTTYWPAGGLLGDPAPDVWYRVKIDLEQDGIATTTPPVGLADLSDVASVRFIYVATGAGSLLHLANVRIVDKSKQPVQVEILSYRKEQDRRAPLAGPGPTYKIEMEMLEVSA